MSRVGDLSVNGSGLRVYDLHFSGVGLGFKILGLGFGVSGLEFRVSGSGFRESGFRFQVQGFGFQDQISRVSYIVSARVSGFGCRVSY